jgi:nitric oxide reductase large subunit
MSDPSAKQSHHITPSSTLEDLAVLALEFHPPTKEEPEGDVIVKEIHPVPDTVIPKESFVVVADPEVIHGTPDHKHRRGTGSFSSFGSLSQVDFEFSKIKVRNWDRKTFYSDYIKMGLEFLEKKTERTIMLFEAEDAKKNKNKFKFLGKFT